MITVGAKLRPFKVTGVPPGQTGEFFEITEESFPGQWKVIVYYPKDFTFVCPTEIVEYDGLYPEFTTRNAVLLTGSTDNEFCKIAWQEQHPMLKTIRHTQFADTARPEYLDRGEWKNNSLVEQLGIFNSQAGAALRGTFIIDPDNVVQHITVNNLNVGRNAVETLRVLDAIQTGGLTACSRPVGGATL
jgi:lipoyl-dependent peroxiredoxin subunit C